MIRRLIVTGILLGATSICGWAQPYPVDELLVPATERIDSANLYRSNAGLRLLTADTFAIRTPGFTSLLRYQNDTATNWRGVVLPAVDLQASADNPLLYSAAGGLLAEIQIRRKLTLSAEAIYFIAEVPRYQARYFRDRGSIPALGRAMERGNTFGSFALHAELSWRINKFFQLSAGNGRKVIGPGIRSLFLSDFAPAYPYAEIQTRIWKVKYHNLFAWQRDLSESSWPGDSKFTSTHVLSFEPTRRFGISIFETIVWQSQDSLSERGFDVNYLNPVIFYRPVEYGIGSADNALLGVQLTGTPLQQVRVYTQFLLDEFLLSEVRAARGWWGNKYGLQVGAIWQVNERLWVQGEGSLVRPFTYSHGSVKQNFAHAGQPLAHPLGSNFREILLRAGYRNGLWYGNAQVTLAEYGRDEVDAATGTLENLGGDIFRSYRDPARIYENEITQGLYHRLLFAQVEGGRIILPDWNLRVFTRLSYRHLRIDRNFQADGYFSVGLSSRLARSTVDY